MKNHKEAFFKIRDILANKLNLFKNRFNRFKIKYNVFKSNKSIIKKLFIITAVVFAMFIGGTLLIQSVFFEKFYIMKKTDQVKDSLKRFVSAYSKLEDSTKIVSLVDEYEQNNNIKLGILNSSGVLSVVQKPAGNRIDPMKTRELDQYARLLVQNPDTLAKIKNSDKIYCVVSTKKDQISRSIVSIDYYKEKNEYVIALSSLQPVNEAVSVIKEMYLYFCIGALFFIIVLAFVYSNMIAKPLVKINKTATKMASLDFTEKCEITSMDEIGNVAASLNFLSENLDNALTSLRDANAQLEKDIEKERRLERTRKEFVAAVSHELKTPITLIDGYAVALKDDIFEGADRDYYLDIIIDEASKMGSLVTDMLDLSQLESGSFKLNKQEFNLTELISYTLKKYEALIEEKSVKLNVNLIDPIFINADWSRMEQVITNFVTNAMRHVDNGGVININTLNFGDKTKIEIENTGSAIPEEEISKIWDKFYKIDKSRNRKLGGTGIGLSIVKNILELHGYSYGVVNTEKGVKFYFTVSYMQTENNSK